MKVKRIYKIFFLLVVTTVAVQTACKKFDENYINPDDEWRSGGAQTVYDAGSGAYSHAFPTLGEDWEKVHEQGDVHFGATFVSSPAPLNPGLGPIFNNVSCASCHINDGRGKIPGPGETAASVLFRISIPGENMFGGPNPVPGFGDQLQTRGILGVIKEADVNVTYVNQTFSFNDGETYSLRVPTYTISNAYTTLPGNVLLSPRVAAPVFGLGLLEAISEQDILSRVDENDRDGDGISGKANYVWSVTRQKAVLGRFGWKANQPDLLQQTAAAFNGDIGITTSLFPVESSFGQTQYITPYATPELTDSLLYNVAFYVKTLAVPARRNATDPTVLQGKQIFISTGCAKCHIPDMRTAVDVSFPAVSNQLIHPYTDMLLHDLGNDLADNRPDFKANGNEWRTAPLWGIGLTQKVNGHTNFLHDGRARNLMEAIMWHGGEAASARDKVKALSSTERNALIKFLESL